MAGLASPSPADYPVGPTLRKTPGIQGGDVMKLQIIGAALLAVGISGVARAADPPAQYKPQDVISAYSKTQPVCPPNLARLYYKDLWRWSSRGAINAGLAVFEYLKWLKIQKHDPVPPYDQCEKL